jgi:hypothetical protein
MRRPWVGSACLLCLVAACSGADPVPPITAGCNPISLDSCTLPYPSSFYLTPDATTRTGVRLSFPAGFLPDRDGRPFLPPGALDGASPAGPILVYFKDGVLADDLPGLHRMADSLADAAPIVLLRADTGERVPYFAELDANTWPGQAGDHQALYVRPLARLAPGTRYVVAVRGLRNAAGVPLAAPMPFRALRDRLATQRPEVTALAARYEGIFDLLAGAGYPRGDLILAWDFVTASDEVITGPLAAMRDDALARLDAGGYGYAITSVAEQPAPELLRRVQGTFDVPWYLDGTGARARLAAGAGGPPAFQGVGSATFTLQIPRCAATTSGPLRLVVYGHGLFGTAAGELDSGYQRGYAEQLCVVQVGTDWLGLTEMDRATTLGELLADLRQIDLVTDKLMQAQVDFVVLTRLVRDVLRQDPALTREGAAGGTPVLDGSEVYYYGCSNGAIQGMAFMALTPDVARGVLDVGGGPWSLLMERSSGFAMLTPVLAVAYPDSADRALLIALWQSSFDHVDPATWGAHALRDPLGDVGPKQILLQESLGDALVPNLGTRYLARTLGLPGLAALLDPPYGIAVEAAPLPSAYTQWSVDPTPFPDDRNVPPANNQAHNGARALPALVEQNDAFWRPDGMVTQTCPEAGCDFPGGG